MIYSQPDWRDCDLSSTHIVLSNSRSFESLPLGVGNTCNCLCEFSTFIGAVCCNSHHNHPPLASQHLPHSWFTQVLVDTTVRTGKGVQSHVVILRNCFLSF